MVGRSSARSSSPTWSFRRPTWSGEENEGLAGGPRSAGDRACLGRAWWGPVRRRPGSPPADRPGPNAGASHRDQGVRRQIVGLHVAAQAQLLAAARVSNGVASGKLPAGYGSLLKLGNDIVQQRRAEFGLQLAGGQGVVWAGDEADTADLVRCVSLQSERLHRGRHGRDSAQQCQRTRPRASPRAGLRPRTFRSTRCRTTES